MLSDQLKFSIRGEAHYFWVRHSWWERLIVRLLCWDRRPFHFDGRESQFHFTIGERWLQRRTLEYLAHLT